MIFCHFYYGGPKMEANSWKYFSSMKKWRHIPENILHPWKNGSKFLNIFFIHEKMGANSWKCFSPMKKWRQIPEHVFHPWKNGGKFLKICFTHENLGANSWFFHPLKKWTKFLKIFFTHEKLGANSWKYFSPINIHGYQSYLENGFPLKNWRNLKPCILQKDSDHFDNLWVVHV